MGRDKADLVPPGGDRTLLRWTVDRLAAVCDEVVVAGGDRHRLAEIAAVADGPGRGPAAGVLGAALARPGRELLVLACDLPLVSAESLSGLLDPQGYDAVVAVTANGPEPLCARYAPRFLTALTRRVETGRFDLVGLLLDPPRNLAIARLEHSVDDFLNLNRPSDLERFAALRHSRLRGRSASR